MRNYIKTVWWELNFHGDDGGGGTQDVLTHIVAADEKGYQIQADLMHRGVAILYPAYTFTIEVRKGPISIYFLFDKSTLMQLLQGRVGSTPQVFPGGTTDLIWSTSIFTVDRIPEDQQVFLNKTETPRYKGWTDPAGVKRAPPPSDEKNAPERSNVQLDLLTLLATLYSLFYQAGDFNSADTMQFYIAKVIRNRAKTPPYDLTEAEKNALFAFLEERGRL